MSKRSLRVSGVIGVALAAVACGGVATRTGEAGDGSSKLEQRPSGSGGSASETPLPATGGDPAGSCGEGPGCGCVITGRWHTHSPPWNNQSTDAVIELNVDGTLLGTPQFSGHWSLQGATFSILDTVGPDMSCGFADTWTLTFASDCNTAPLLPIGSGCTGARRYLDWDVTLTRQ